MQKRIKIPQTTCSTNKEQLRHCSGKTCMHNHGTRKRVFWYITEETPLFIITSNYLVHKRANKKALQWIIGKRRLENDAWRLCCAFCSRFFIETCENVGQMMEGRKDAFYYTWVRDCWKVVFCRVKSSCEVLHILSFWRKTICD